MTPSSLTAKNFAHNFLKNGHVWLDESLIFLFWVLVFTHTIYSNHGIVDHHDDGYYYRY